jgi:hypothetical protein
MNRQFILLALLIGLTGCGPTATGPEATRTAAVGSSTVPTAIVTEPDEPRSFETGAEPQRSRTARPESRLPIGRIVKGTHGAKPSSLSGVAAQPVAPAVMAAARAKHVQRPTGRVVHPPRSQAASYRRSQMAALTAFCATSPPDPRCLGTRVNERVAFPAEAKP